MDHRREIDGLRAVAVIPVILFHAGISGFSGGYVGVDVFFVISGFLITSIILNDLKTGHFSLLGFYEKRARRILPALFLILFFSSIFAYYFFLPGELLIFSKSLGSVAVFISNIFFWKQDSYFAQTAESMPLLHTWSLAVEEQYYFLFPITMILLWKYERAKLTTIIAFAALLSFVFSEWASHSFPTANFFLLPSRAWELLSGSMCAVILSRQQVKENDALTVIGLTLIIFPVFLFDSSLRFPSVYALAPVGGTVLIILFAGKNTFGQRLLAARPFVGIGLISYSAYLWHQPLFAFARIRSIETPPQHVMLLLALLSLGLAYLTWKFVEQPFRSRNAKSRFSRWQVFSFSAVGMCIALTFMGTTITLKGDLGRYSPAQVALLDHATRDLAHPQVSAGCSKGFFETDFSPCMVGDSQSNRLIVMLGDSHARQWIDALDQIGRENGWRVAVYSKAACSAPQVKYAYPKLKRNYSECTSWRSSSLDNIRKRNPDLIILTSSSFGYLRTDYDPVSFSNWRDGIIATFRSTGPSKTPKIWLFDNPRLKDISPVKCLIREKLMNTNITLCEPDISDIVDIEIRDFERKFVAGELKYNFVDFTKYYCPYKYCKIVQDGKLLMLDDNHLSQDTTTRLSPYFAEVICTTLKEK